MSRLKRTVESKELEIGALKEIPGETSEPVVAAERWPCARTGSGCRSGGRVRSSVNIVPPSATSPSLVPAMTRYGPGCGSCSADVPGGGIAGRGRWFVGPLGKPGPATSKTRKGKRPRFRHLRKSQVLDTLRPQRETQLTSEPEVFVTLRR